MIVTLPQEAFTGTYFNLGYRKISLAMKSVPRIDPIFHCSTTQVFRVEMLNRTFHVILDFEHVSGELFMVHIINPYTYRMESFKTDPERSEGTRGLVKTGDGRGEDMVQEAGGMKLKGEEYAGDNCMMSMLISTLASAPNQVPFRAETPRFRLKAHRHH